MTTPAFSPSRGIQRTRNSEGTVEKVGKRVKKWLGYWYIYLTVAGNEVRRRRKKILGPGTMSKADAKEALRRHIASSRGVELVAAPDLTVSALWDRYVAYKSASWGGHMRSMMCSVFKNCVMPLIGTARVVDLTIDPLQRVLMQAVADGYGVWTLRRVRVHLKAMLEYAVDIDLISRNPARGKKLVVPKGSKKSSGYFLEMEQVQKLLKAARGREHLILRLCLLGGFRPQELFVLRVNDIEEGRIRVDEALKQTEKGDKRLGDPKTEDSTGYVAISASLQKELTEWVSCLVNRGQKDWLFPSKTGTPFRPPNYLNRTLKPVAESAGVEGVTFRVLRRTCATHFKKDIKSAQAQLRHASPTTTANVYMKTISSEHKAAVETLDAEFSKLDTPVIPRTKRAGGAND